MLSNVRPNNNATENCPGIFSLPLIVQWPGKRYSRLLYRSVSATADHSSQTRRCYRLQLPSSCLARYHLSARLWRRGSCRPAPGLGPPRWPAPRPPRPCAAWRTCADGTAPTAARSDGGLRASGFTRSTRSATPRRCAACSTWRVPVHGTCSSLL